jgi:hypothetical protein
VAPGGNWPPRDSMSQPSLALDGSHRTSSSRWTNTGQGVFSSRYTGALNFLLGSAACQSTTPQWELREWEIDFEYVVPLKCWDLFVNDS